MEKKDQISINPQICTVTKLRCREEETVVRRRKATGLGKREYGNCEGITYLRPTETIRGNHILPRTRNDHIAFVQSAELSIPPLQKL